MVLESLFRAKVYFGVNESIFMHLKQTIVTQANVEFL